jgi:hypothetical protein
LLGGLVNTRLVKLLSHRLPVAKHIYPYPAPKQEVESLRVNLDTPRLAECENTNQHQHNAGELGDLSEATFQHSGVFLAFRGYVAIGRFSVEEV